MGLLNKLKYNQTLRNVKKTVGKGQKFKAMRDGLNKHPALGVGLAVCILAISLTRYRFSRSQSRVHL